jgi:hypothetical protein
VCSVLQLSRDGPIPKKMSTNAHFNDLNHQQHGREEEGEEEDGANNHHHDGTSSPSTTNNATTTTNKRSRTMSSSVPSESRLLELSIPLTTTRSKQETIQEKEDRTERLSKAVKELISCLGEDPQREGLMDTPRRSAEAFLFWTKGYEENLVRTFLFFKDPHSLKN